MSYAADATVLAPDTLFRAVKERPGETLRAIYTGEAPGRMEKTADGRTPNRVAGTTYDDVHAEYDALVAMHAVDPGYVPEPLERTADGYAVAVEPVLPLKEVRWPRPALRDLPLPDVDPDAVATELGAALDRYHAHGLVHGDVTLRNVAVYRDGSPLLLDPAGVPGVSPADPAIGTLKAADRDALDDILDAFR